MKKAGSILLLLLYLFSMVQTLVPVISFEMNHDYIKKHLCRSLTQPEFGDCDGFCYLKKKIEDHQDHDMDSHGTTATVPKVPFVYLVKIQSKKLFSGLFSSDELRFKYDETYLNDFFLDISSPPPQS
tara:strand:+ start:19418 stop:19798 length:381 start_codon:yes stop_codon:yes gene_type:complete